MTINSTLRIMGVGIIVRDHMGQVHAASSKTIHSVQEPVVAKAMGALLAARFSRDLGIQEIGMEGDSLQVVKAIRDPDTQWNSYGHITGDTRWILFFEVLDHWSCKESSQFGSSCTCKGSCERYY